MSSPNKKRKIEELNNTTEISEKLQDKIYDIFNEVQEDLDTYLDIPNIIEGIKILIKDNSEGMINRCMVCQVDMGRCNPRQLCRKVYCENE
jgi:hypothetical protein